MSLQVDKNAAMGIVMDVQGKLRKADSRKIQYAASQGLDEGSNLPK
ncbi:hypothetical protein AB9P05_14680 [Roseivirga sp. BDSF3-8]